MLYVRETSVPVSRMRALEQELSERWPCASCLHAYAPTQQRPVNIAKSTTKCLCLPSRLFEGVMYAAC